MSRFNNPRALRTLAPSPVNVGPVNRSPVVPTTTPVIRVTAVTEPRSSFLQTACFITLCVFLLAGYANEFSYQLTGTKAYLSTVTVVLLPVLLVLTGNALSGLALPLGRWFFAFGAWLAICAPFSVWKGDTFRVLTTFYFRGFIVYFAICACIVTVGRLKVLIYILAIGNFFVLMSCFFFGSTKDGRFFVPTSVFSFLANSNELALQLLLGILVLLFAFLRGGTALRIISTFNMAASAVLMLKTGSRGVFVAALAVMVAGFFFARNKVKVIAIAVPVTIVALILLPASTWNRLTQVAVGSNVSVSSAEEASAVLSQLQRQRLFWDSVWVTFTHPIFGVGPGEFVVQDSNDKTRSGQVAIWRETHNAYTQVSSESGFPGFIFFVACIVVCIRMNYRIYRQTRDRTGLEDFAGLSFCMLLSIIGFAVGAIFDHLAYGAYIPTMLGITAVTYWTSQPAIQNWSRSQAGTQRSSS